MNAPLYKLKCHKCQQTLESMTILLPDHAIGVTPPGAGYGYFKQCPGSEILALNFVDPCPICQNTSYRDDCPCCKGTHEVLTPIDFQMERKYNDENYWANVSIAVARHSLKSSFRNPDDVISAIYAGEPIKTQYAEYRLKKYPRVNDPINIESEPEVTPDIVDMLNETAYETVKQVSPETIRALEVYFHIGGSVEKLDRFVSEHLPDGLKKVVLINAAFYMHNHPETWKE